MKNKMDYVPETWKQPSQMKPNAYRKRITLNDIPHCETIEPSNRAAVRGFGGFWTGATLGSWCGPLGLMVGGIVGATVGAISAKRRERNDRIEALLIQIANK